MPLKAADPILYPRDKDLLHHSSHFIDHLHRLVTGSIQPPYAVSIDGSWGTGKTTVMQLLKKRLDRSCPMAPGPPSPTETQAVRADGSAVLKYPTFWFNPWEYQDAESIVLAFLQRFAAEMLEGREMLRQGLKLLGYLGYVGLDIALTAIPANLAIFFKRFKNLEAVRRDYRNFEKAFSKPHESYTDLIEIIKADFSTLVKHVSKAHDNRPVVVFFDDLDRCLPDKAIRLLEAIKNLFVLKDTPVIFVCGIDTHVAKQFIVQHYSRIDAAFAVNYFRKIFNLTIRLPFKPGDLNVFLRAHIQQQFNLEDAPASVLAEFICQLGIDAGLASLRKYISVLDNLQVFILFNTATAPEFRSTGDFAAKKETLMLVLLAFQQAWPLLYHDFVRTAVKHDRKSVMEIAAFYLEQPGASAESQSGKLTSMQHEYVARYLHNKEFSYYSENLCGWLQSNPVF